MINLKKKVVPAVAGAGAADHRHKAGYPQRQAPEEVKPKRSLSERKGSVFDLPDLQFHRGYGTIGKKETQGGDGNGPVS